MKYLLALLFLPIHVLATNFYVSNLGDDTNPGTLAQPWATLGKVNSVMGTGTFVAGDSILLARGSEFFGTLTISRTGVILGAYGTGSTPVITGFKTLTGWTNSGTNLWNSATASPKSYMKVVTLNGVMIRMGRYPDWADAPSAWLTYINNLPAGTTPVNVTSQQSLPTTFVGGELVLRKEPYVLDVMPILSQTGTNLNNFSCTNPDPFWKGIAGFGYFIQNHPSTLTIQNEWYFNPSSKNLTFFSSSSPIGIIKGAVFDTLVRVTVADVTIENLDIQGSNRFGIHSTGSNLTLKNSIIRFAGYFGVQPLGSYTITNNTIRDVATCAIYANNSGLIQGNQVKAIGMIDGMGASGNDLMFGIALESNNITVRNNVVDSISYSGIKIGGSTNGNNILIRENVVSNTCMNKTDGGGIYSYGAAGTWNLTNRVIKRNILVNNGKIVYGMPGDDVTLYFPMYMDGGAMNVIIDSNVIAYDNVSQNSSANLGLYDNFAILLNNPRNITVTNNITFAFPVALSINDWSPSIPVTPIPSGNVINNNCFYVNNIQGVNYKETNCCFIWRVQGFKTLPTIQSNIQAMGTMNNNFYPNIQSPFHWTSTTCCDGPFPVLLPEWRTFSGKDINSTSIQATVPEFQYNATSSPTTYDFSGRQKRDFKGNIYNNQATIPPYYANIFFDNGPATGGGLQASSTATQISCFGGNSTVTVSATGGTPPYTGTGNFTRAAGTWSFVVTDAATPTPNTITTTITITQPLALTATSSKTNILCNGQTNGSINVFPIGGTPPYSYNWGGGITTQNRTGLAIGTYTCTITDSRNCLTTTSQTITQPTALTAGNPTAPNILVNGGTTTITQPAATGGTSPYQYQLNTGVYQTSNVFSNVPAGTYTINIRDANNCIISKLITITQPVVFSASASAGNISCNGGTTIVVVSASGGTPPYTGTGTFVVTAGAYNYIVTDAGGSTASASITVTQPSALTLSATQVNVLCNGNSTGSINTTPGGGTPPYTYLWNTGQTTQNRTGLSANTYSVTLTDANTCSTSQSITITQPTALSVTATRNPTNILCFGGTSAVTITASGGRSPYSGIGTFNQSVGTITYNVTDANSCPASQSVTLTQPTQLTAANPTATPITVNGGTTTIVQPAPSGGTSPYMYSLNTGAFQTSNAFQNTRAGSYSVTIRDANGCTIIKSITITQPAVFTATATQTVPINCNGQRATVVVSATGGTSPYTGTGTFQVGSGQYVFTVTDSLGNTAPASITITQPSQVIATSTAGAITSIGGTTNIIVSAVGGIQPYAGTGSFTRQAGTYSFTVTDANGCPSVTTITVNQPTPIPNQSFNSPLPIRNGN
jgi:hypothetical protein